MVKEKWTVFNARVVMLTNIKKTLIYTFVAIILFSGQFLFSSNKLQGKPPLIAEHTIEGRDVAGMVDKGPVIIYFWAEWCGICKMMQSAVSAVLEEYPGITIAVRSGTDSQVEAYLRQYQLNWPVVNDPNSEVAQQYGVKGVPSLIIVNKKGEVSLIASGYTSEIGIKFRIWLSDVFSG